MGELGLNKIFGALLAVGLVVLGLKEVSTIVFGGGHHGHHEYESLNQWAEENFHGYRIDIAETGGGGEIVEEAPPHDFFNNPQEPRTQKFLKQILQH